MQDIKEHERKGEKFTLELRRLTRELASLINQIPDPIAILRAQNIATAIGFMMMDLASSDPIYFFTVWPIVEKEIGEAKAAENLVRLRVRQPLVRNQIQNLRN